MRNLPFVCSETTVQEGQGKRKKRPVTSAIRFVSLLFRQQKGKMACTEQGGQHENDQNPIKACSQAQRSEELNITAAVEGNGLYLAAKLTGFIMLAYNDLAGLPVELYHTAYTGNDGAALGKLKAQQEEKAQAAGRQEAVPVKEEKVSSKWKCQICGYEHEGEELPEGFTCPWCKQGAENFHKV